MSALSRHSRIGRPVTNFTAPPRDTGALANFRRAILFGASAGASEVEKILGKLGVEIAAFADSNPAKQSALFRGRPVIDPSALPSWMDGTTAIVITSVYQQEIAERLGSLGILPDFVFPFISPMFDGHFGQPAFALADESFIGLPARLADDASRGYLEALLAFRWTMNPTKLHRNAKLRGFYDYDSADLGPRPGDHIVDVGAYDGDSAVAYLTRLGGQGRVSALEPLPQNHAKLLETQRTHAFGSAITPMPFGAGDAPATATLESDDEAVDPRATIRGKAGQATTIRIDTLDRLFAADPVDFIKIDIEGLEPTALTGARAVLNRDRPGLAIAGYHAAEHLWTLPRLLDDLCPGYRIYLGHHPAAVYECEFFCVHEHRIGV